MNIRVTTDKSIALEDAGGGFANTLLEICIDGNLSMRTQRHTVTHEIIEAYCRSWPHSRVEQLADLIQDGLDQLEGNA